MRYEEFGKEGLKLWVIWSNSKFAKNIRTFIKWAVICQLVGYCLTYIFFWWWPSIFFMPLAIWIVMYTIPMWVLRSEGEAADVAWQKQKQDTLDLIAKRNAKQKVKDILAEEKRLSGKKRNP